MVDSPEGSLGRVLFAAELEFPKILVMEENIVAVTTHDWVIDDNLKRQIKNRTFCTCSLFLLTKIFLILISFYYINFSF